MSLETWKQEFYPIEADQVEKKDALKHSLRKWIGLRRENLQKHGVVCTIGWLWDGPADLPISEDSCALCQHYEYGDTDRCMLVNEAGDDEYCPLDEILGGPCDLDETMPYNKFQNDNDNVEPMISALQACIEKEKGE